jgi:hypothetical protein
MSDADTSKPAVRTEGDTISKPVVPTEGHADTLTLEEIMAEEESCRLVDLELAEYFALNVQRRKVLARVRVNKIGTDKKSRQLREERLEKIVRLLHIASNTAEEARKVSLITSDISPFSGVVLSSFFLFKSHLTK